MAERSWQIYVLKDPRRNEILYVGRTKNPTVRLAAHISDATKANRKNTRKNNRLHNMIAAGVMPVLEIVESGTGDSAEAECRWITTMRSRGINLLNETDGGEGVRGLMREPRTPEHQANARAALNEAMKRPEVRARLSAALTGYKRSPEHCENLAKALSGKPLSPEHRARISAGLKASKRIARPMTLEARQKLSAAKRGQKLSPEHRARISEALLAKWNQKKGGLSLD